jgi:hypothetical protein
MSDLLTEIASWKLEAKLENNKRYFYNTADVALVNRGVKCFVIGRKGTGKTAIREHLAQDTGPRRFIEKLTFKNFPFNELYQHTNTRYTPPNQYITLWKYLIYCHIAKMMIRNQAISPPVRTDLEKAFPSEVVPTLAKSVRRFTSPEFRLSVFGIEIAGGLKREHEANITPWIDRCELLESLIAEHIDDSSYLIVFDELDEDYRDVSHIERLNEYMALLTSLFKAVQDVKAVYPQPRYNIYPVIFLRDDIYDILRDSDKTKWNDFRLELNWTGDEINNLLAFRLSRAASPAGKILNLSEALRSAFHKAKIKEIRALSLQRPRDLISFCQIAAKIALERQLPHIDGAVIQSATVPYSTYLRSDLEDEIEGSLPDIKMIIDILAAIRRPDFTVDDFEKAYEVAVKRGKVEHRDPVKVLEVLFNFSVIGNKISPGSVFRFRNLGAKFNPEEEITVFAGLLPALNIRRI